MNILMYSPNPALNLKLTETYRKFGLFAFPILALTLVVLFSPTFPFMILLPEWVLAGILCFGFLAAFYTMFDLKLASRALVLEGHPQKEREAWHWGLAFRWLMQALALIFLAFCAQSSPLLWLLIAICALVCIIFDIQSVHAGRKQLNLKALPAIRP